MSVGPHSTLLLTHYGLLAYLFYTDPGSGVLVWQLILAAFFGGMFYVRKLKNLILRRRRERTGAE
jgi:hypothetical protein